MIYFRPEVPENSTYSRIDSFLYGHACHTLDQVISYFGEPDEVYSDVRQLLGKGRMNDYFDLDLYYGKLKVSVKSSYFRLTPRPSFIVYGKKGSFIKETKDRQEEHLKQFYMPTEPDFGVDLPQHYGTLTYMDDDNDYHQEKSSLKWATIVASMKMSIKHLLTSKIKLLKTTKLYYKLNYLKKEQNT